MVPEYDGNDQLQARYVPGLGIDKPVLMDRGGTLSYYHYDGTGSVIAMTDDFGVVAESYAYSPFGESAETDLVGNPYRYTGRRLDAETGLYYYRARHYDPVLGRFLQTDPAGYIDGLNLYAYVGNDPLNFADPYGLATQNSGLTRHVDALSGYAAVATATTGAVGTAGGVALPGSIWEAVKAFGIRLNVWLAVLSLSGDTPQNDRAVIGEGMETRVIPHANSIGAEYYIPPEAPREMWLENNRIWINQKMDQYYEIIDIGPEPGGENYPAPTSPFYKMELNEIDMRGYTLHYRVNPGF